jgi:hypothetical protein
LRRGVLHRDRAAIEVRQLCDGYRAVQPQRIAVASMLV